MTEPLLLLLHRLPPALSRLQNLQTPPPISAGEASLVTAFRSQTSCQLVLIASVGLPRFFCKSLSHTTLVSYLTWSTPHECTGPVCRQRLFTSEHLLQRFEVGEKPKCCAVELSHNSRCKRRPFRFFSTWTLMCGRLSRQIFRKVQTHLIKRDSVAVKVLSLLRLCPSSSASFLICYSCSAYHVSSIVRASILFSKLLSVD
mmetsp:Transcript_53787/g.109652  ORF Transcript_53787/g.109652 Transcript_53787/m.109652 type:complete len:201 (-) Transcript_53787:275-877(-)